MSDDKYGYRHTKVDDKCVNDCEGCEFENGAFSDMAKLGAQSFNGTFKHPTELDRGRAFKNDIGVKYDQGKTRWGLLVGLKATKMVAEVLTYGAKKYSPNNFKYVKGWRWRYVDATFRHINAYMGGEIIDPETGFHHLSQAIASLTMLLDNELNNMPNGDDQ